jgi:adenylate cyclase
MKRGQKKNFRKLIAAVITAVVTVILTNIPQLQIKAVYDIEKKFIDSRFYNRGIPAKTAEPSVVIVEITDNTYQQIPEPYNRSPLPRSLFAKFVTNMTRAGAKAIGIDIIMSDKDQFSSQNDSLFDKAIKQCKNVVLAGQIYEQNGNFYQYKNLKYNFGCAYYWADSSIGIVQVDNDEDGVLRRYVPCFSYSASDKLIPGFAFAVMNKYYGLPKDNIVKNNLFNFEYAGKTIPKYNRNSFLLNFYGSDKYFKSVDFIDVIDDSAFTTVMEKETGEQINMWDDPNFGLLYSGMFKDKIVILGSKNYLDRDIISVSYAEENDTTLARQQENRVYGVMVHATAIENVLTGSHIKSEPLYLSIIIVFVFSIISFYFTSLTKKLRLRFSIINEFINLAVIAGLFYFILYLSFFIFSKYSYLTSIVNPCFAILLGYISSSAYEFFSEKKQKGLIKKIFSQYVSSAVVEELIDNPDKVTLQGEIKNITALFSDIEGFSTFSEKMDPQILVRFLNDYFDEMTKIVIEESGTLDKFIGDSVMAFWGAPLVIKDHALKACKAAIRMQNKLDELQSVWQSRGFPPVNTRIGINTGEMIVGNVGGEKRFNYTIIGNNVNIASRLEGINKNFGTKIIISESAYNLVKNEVETRELGKIAPKGISEEIRIFELTGIKE